MLARLLLTITALVFTLVLPSAGQEREVELQRLPEVWEPTTPGTVRDPAADALDALHGQAKKWATTEVNKLSRWDRAGFTKRMRAAQYRQQQALVRGGANLHANRWYKGLGVVTFLADGGATVGGHWAEGDKLGAATAALDEGAQTLSAAGGAWAGGKAGAAVGTFFGGPPGAMVGGAIGAAAGAALVTVGYNAYVAPEVSEMTDALEGAFEPNYLELAKQSRAEHLAAAALRKAEKQAAIDQARQNRREFLERSAAGAGESAPPPADTRPVIPLVCTIVAELRYAAAPEMAHRWTFEIRDGRVTGRMAPIPIPQLQSDANIHGATTFTCALEGVIEENRIAGTMTERIGPFEQWGTNEAEPWRRRLTYTWPARKATAVLAADGTLTFTREEGESRIRVQVLEGEGWEGRKEWTHTSKDESVNLDGVWRIAD